MIGRYKSTRTSFLHVRGHVRAANHSREYYSKVSGSSGIEELRVWLGNIAARAAGSTVMIVGTHLDKVTEEVCRIRG